MRSASRRIVILGGGSGGLELASQLARQDNLDVVLVDREPAHVWKPRLHEMAAGTVATSLAEISFYLLAQLRGFRFEQGEVKAIDRQARTVSLGPISHGGRELAQGRDLAYDLCVVALGGTTPDFGTAGVAENAIRLDARDDAEAFRDRYTALMIAARTTSTPAEICIVGSGPTGTELAAHLRISERGFAGSGSPRSKGQLLSITLIEAAPEIMPGIDAQLREEIVRRLRALDVKIVTDAQVSEIGRHELRTVMGESWPSDLTVWAVGLAGNPALRDLADFELDRKGRIVVDERLRSTVDPAIYALGDAAAYTPAGSEKPLPPTAQAASQQAAYLSDALASALAGDKAEPFSFGDRGRLVSLGHQGTVGRIGSRRKGDLFIDGQFATAAYHALERQHQWRVLGPFRGTAAIFADMISPAKGPALELHGPGSFSEEPAKPESRSEA